MGGSAKKLAMLAVNPTQAWTMLIPEVGKTTAPAPIPTPTAPSVDSTAAKEAAAREAERLRKRKGAASTIATGPQGVQTEATTYKKTLGD